jgi:hypothetical protein
LTFGAKKNKLIPKKERGQLIQKFWIITIIVLICNSVVVADFTGEQDHAMLESSNLLDDAVRYRVKKIRVYVPAKPITIRRAMAYVYGCTLVAHLWRGGVCGYLAMCTPLTWLAPAVAVTVFVMSCAAITKKASTASRANICWPDTRS